MYNERTPIRTGHVIYNPAYTYKVQLKTTLNRYYSLKLIMILPSRYQSILNRPFLTIVYWEVHYEKKLTKNIRPTGILQIYTKF